MAQVCNLHQLFNSLGIAAQRGAKQLEKQLLRAAFFLKVPLLEWVKC